MSNGAFTTGIRRKKVGALIALVAAPAVAAASDGVIEINQASALAGGVTASDAPGFPVTLTSSGSFVLTGDLVLPDANTTGIVVLADDVRIDLAGFSIRGVVSCAPAADAVVCTPAGTGIGIESQSELTRVRDGVVRGMGGDGIRVADAARVEDVIVSDNGGNGIETGLFALIRDVLAQRNGARGIELGGSSRVVGAQAFLNGNCGVRGGTNVMLERVQASANQVCGVLATDVTLIESSASGNSGMGVVIDASAVLRGNQVIGNTSNGISTLAGAPGLPGTEAVIEGNVIRASGFAGIQGVTDAVIANNVVTDNGTTAVSCAALVSDADGCVVAQNVLNRNGNRGLSGFSATGYTNNIISGNASGSVSSGAQELGTNLCDETTTCP